MVKVNVYTVSYGYQGEYLFPGVPRIGEYVNVEFRKEWIDAKVIAVLWHTSDSSVDVTVDPTK